MKTRILGLLILFSTIPFLSQAQLPDLDFENWNTNTLFENPDNYTTNNVVGFLLGFPPNVTKVSGAQGNAARLETVLAIQGMLGNDPANRGVPFTSLPDSIRITYRSNLQSGDTALIVFLFKVGGIPFGGSQISISGNQSNFITMSYPVLGLPQTPDSMLMVAQSGNMTGSWIEIDNIFFVNSAQQMANNGLNNWTMLQYKDPQGWSSPNVLSALFNQPQSVRQNTSDVYTGSSSVEIQNTVISLFGGIDTIGYLINTNIFLGGSNAGSPYTAQPEKLSFYYKYTPVGNDSAFVGVIFSKWNSLSGISDSINGNIMRLGAASTFTKMELPFNWTGAPNPDSVLIGLASGDLETESGNPGSKVIFDNLMFEFGVGISTPVPAFANAVQLYPNPAGDHLYIDLSHTDLQSGQVRIVNILGQSMYAGSFNGTDNPMLINLEGYQSGTYLYEIRSGETTFTGKFIVH